jgi:hypothetical protein
MVYKLYGLTEEEIAIVEGIVNQIDEIIAAHIGWPKAFSTK